MPGPVNRGTQRSSVGSPSEAGSTPSTGKTQTAQRTSRQAVVPQTPQQAKAAQQHATSKASDALIQQHARGLAPTPGKEQQIRSIAQGAKRSGLNDQEVTKLTNHLKSLNAETLRSELSFLRGRVLGTPNAARALRTYTELSAMQKQHPSRIQQDHVRTLTQGVAEPRTSLSRGTEGVLSQQSAIHAAKALIGMPKSDYQHLNKLLYQAGKTSSANPKDKWTSSPLMEKSLILKAAAARHKELGKPNTRDRLKTLTGKPSSTMAEIQTFASQIRGKPRGLLAQQSTSIDPYHGNKALQQRWADTCGPTTAQGMKAEIDPIYARKLHNEFIHSTKTTGRIAQEQKSILETDGGKAVKRGARGGVGSIISNVLNKEVKKYTGVNYGAYLFGNTRDQRSLSLNIIADRLKKGIDIPFNVTLRGGGQHAMLMTDVRGSGNSQRFLVTDPWTGKTAWISRQELMKDRTKFPFGSGTLKYNYR